MGTLLLRRSSTSSLFNRLAVAGLNSLSNPHQIHTCVPDRPAKLPSNQQAFPLTRAFHSGQPLLAGFGRKADEISNLGISEGIVAALSRRGISKLLPVQSAVFEPAMQGRDMIGRARPVTGKTLAFGIPIMDKIIQLKAENGQGRNPLALIMVPTRQLAIHVDREFSELAPKLATLRVHGKVPISRPVNSLDHGVDVVVGTPGHLIDLIKSGSLNLSEVQFVVLDEADQMVDVGFAEDVETLLGYITQQHQTMMFSATMPKWIVNLAQKFLKNPLAVDLMGDSGRKSKCTMDIKLKYFG